MTNYRETPIAPRSRGLAAFLAALVFLACVASIGAKLHQAAHGEHNCGDGFVCAVAALPALANGTAPVGIAWVAPDRAVETVLPLGEYRPIPLVSVGRPTARGPPGFISV